MPLPARNITSYNGYVFSNVVETIGIQVTPVLDEAKRTVIYNRYMIRLRDIIAGNNQVGAYGAVVQGVQTQLRSRLARQLLTKSGGIFIYTNRGVGDIAINTGLIRDIKYGPTVLDLSFKPEPGNIAVAMEWAVEFCLPECPAAKYAFAASAFNYRVRYSIGRYGETTRVISGYIEIPANRGGGALDRTLSDSVDNYREQVNPPMQPGFRRIPGEFTVNFDKTRMEFSITDEEMFGPAPPPGIIDAKVSRGVSSTTLGLVKWVNTIDARYWVAKGFQKGLAVEAFLALVADQTTFTARQLNRSPATLIPLALRMYEPEVYSAPSDPTAAFSLVYTFTATISQIFGASGLWRPVRFGDWNAWAATMANILGPRGNAKLVLKAGDDRITDLCDPSVRTVPPRPEPTEPQERIIQAVAGVCPPPADSWIQYEVHVETESDDGLIDASLITQKPPIPVPKNGYTRPNQADDNVFFNPSEFLAGNGLAADFLGSPSQKQGVLQSSLQQRTGPIAYVYLVGRAMRVCYPINPPSLVKVDEMVPVAANRTEKGEGFKQGMITQLGHPIYAAKWRIRYAVPSGYIAKMPVPDNPIMNPNRGRF